MNKGQAHPAALTSKKMISGALLEIMKEKEYKHITITEVCSRAQIARRTFYRNFETMDDVLLFLAKNIIDQFKIMIKEHSEGTFYEVLVAYFTFWSRQSDMLKLLMHKGLTAVIFIEYIKSLEEVPCLYRLNPSADIKTEEYPLVQAFIAGGLWSLLSYSITHNCEQTPQELADILTRQLHTEFHGNR